VVAFERDTPRSPDERPPPATHAYPAYPAGPSRAARAPLIKRISKRRWVAFDYVVAAFAALCDLVVMRQGLVDMGHAWFPAALVLATAVSAPMALRRRAPIPALGALIILALLLSSMTPTVGAIIFLATAYVLYTVTASSSRRTGVAALGLVLITMVIAASVSHGLDPGVVEGAFVPVAFANIIAWMTGYSVRQRRLYVVHLQHQAASSAVAEERLRIARELHDVVAHSMSVIAVQAGYGQYVIDTSPDGARDALGAIQATSRDALEEMRRMLGVLRQQDVAPIPPDADSLGTADTADPMATAADPLVTRSGAADAETAGPRAGTGACAGSAGRAPLAPAPGLADLDRLIKRTGGAGLRVGLHVSGQVRPVPAGIDLSAYRIIQEALTNVVKHSGSARCTVSLGYGSGVLDVRVLNEGGLVSGRAGLRAAPSASLIGTGHGIIGMRERVNLCGGTFKAGSLADGGFLVAATLPLPLPTADGGAFQDSAIHNSAIHNSAIEGSAIKTGAIKTSAIEGSVAGHSGGQA
jgi:signal transduction histidine kinase